MRIFLISILVLLIGLLVSCQVYFVWLLNQARRKGLYPYPGKATLFDVKRLLIMGEPMLAITVYREIYGVGFRDAKKAVEELEKSLRT